MILSSVILFIGIVSGFVLGLIGAGSGLVGIPLMVYLLNIPIHNAISMSLIATAIMTYFYMFKTMKHKLIKWSYGIPIGAAGMISVPLGAKVSFYFAPQYLKILFGFLMLISGYFIWRSTREQFPAIEKDIRIPKQYQTLFLIASGALAGFMSGLSGIGGSIITMPVFLLIMNLKMRNTSATNIFVIAALTTLSAISHAFINSNLNAFMALVLTIGGAIGVMLGLSLSLKTCEHKLKRNFAIATTIVGAWMLISNIIR